MILPWSNEEKTTLRYFTIRPEAHDRHKLSKLVEHFKAGGGISKIVDVGDPVHASQDFARKIRELTKRGILDWLVEEPKPEDGSSVEKIIQLQTLDRESFESDTQRETEKSPTNALPSYTAGQIEVMRKFYESVRATQEEWTFRSSLLMLDRDLAGKEIVDISADDTSGKSTQLNRCKSDTYSSPHIRDNAVSEMVPAIPPLDPLVSNILDRVLPKDLQSIEHEYGEALASYIGIFTKWYEMLSGMCMCAYLSLWNKSAQSVSTSDSEN